MAAIEADSFKTIELINDGKTANLTFRHGDDVIATVEMPIERFELGISEMLRIVESARQQRGASAGGIQAVAFSTAQTIEPRADIAAARLYLVIDRGMPHQIAFGLRMVDASKLGLAIYTEVEKWITATKATGSKQ